MSQDPAFDAILSAGFSRYHSRPGEINTYGADKYRDAAAVGGIST